MDEAEVGERGEKMERIKPLEFQALHQKEDITVLDVREVEISSGAYRRCCECTAQHVREWISAVGCVQTLLRDLPRRDAL